MKSDEWQKRNSHKRRAEETEIRLNKFLAECGVCSRRDADVMIASGKVLVNGVSAQMGQKVKAADEVQVGKRILRCMDTDIQKKVVLACYKPVGVTCTERDTHAEKKITDMVKYPVRVTYAGRLDKDSEGLLLMTNDGALIDAMMRGANQHEKEYIVKVNKEITKASLETLSQGMYLEDLDVRTRPCTVEKIGKYTFRIVLTQGLNRQIRRMCKALGYQVQHLKRVRVMNVLLGELKPGDYRELDDVEMTRLYAAVGLIGEN